MYNISGARDGNKNLFMIDLYNTSSVAIQFFYRVERCFPSMEPSSKIAPWIDI